jgi:ABC-2 type transport system ATP-binding protein
MNLEPAPLIRISHLSKNYDGIDALKDISFDIFAGKSYGLVGPNGAGKTTLIRMLCALIPVSAGQIEYEGKRISFSDSNKHQLKKSSPQLIRFRKIIGFVPQATALDEKLSAWENLELEAQLYHRKSVDVVSEIGQLLEFFQLSDRHSIPVKTFSGGMKRRLELARALLHNPQILVLDEPTLGLDPAAKLQIWEHLRTLQSTQNITMLISTNNMEEADVLCDQIAILDRGLLVAYGSPAELKGQFLGDTVTVEVDPHDDDAVNSALQQLLQAENSDLSFHMEKFFRLRPGVFKCYVDSGEMAIQEISARFAQQGILLRSIWQQKPTLDDVFIYFTQRETGIKFDQVDTLVKIINALGLDKSTKDGHVGNE